MLLGAGASTAWTRTTPAVSGSAGVPVHQHAPTPLLSAANIDVSRSAQSLSTNGSNGRTLVFGDGDDSDGLPDPLEPLENLRKILTRAGNTVTVAKRLPTILGGIKTIWFVGIHPLSQAEQTELVGFVRNGGGLYLTGERNCCEASNRADEAIIDQLATLRPSRVGDGADVDEPYIASNTVNANAIDGVGQTPNRLTTWQPSAPGVLSGLATRNALTFAYQDGLPVVTGEVWDGSELAGGSGRLAILMDVNWLEATYWDAGSAQGMALNLQRFLGGGDFRAQPQGDAYVALGDSYSSGEGNPKFEPSTDKPGANECHRSAEPNGAYARIVEKALGNPSFAFVACSGSTIGNIWSGKGSRPPQGQSKDPEPLQIGALSGATRVVTLTIGGNDVGFADVIKTCIEQTVQVWHSNRCTAAGLSPAPPILQNLQSNIQKLKYNLEQTYYEIHRAARSAQIYVLGYPNIFPLTVPDGNGCLGDTGLEHSSIEWLIKRQAELNKVVEEAATNQHVQWVNPNTGAHSFLGHDICSSSSWFIRPDNRSFEHYSFHPTKTGQENLAATLVAKGAKKAIASPTAMQSSSNPEPTTGASPAAPRSVVPDVDPDDASLSGTVTAAGGSPLAGVQAYAETSDGSFAGQGESGPDGGYSITGLGAGSYKVEFYPDLGEYEPQWWDGKYSEADATLVELAAGQSVGHIDAELTPDATISGKVTSAGGEALAGVQVYAESTEGPSGYAETAADGTYAVPGLQAGGYEVEFYLDQSGQHYETQWYEAKSSEAEADIVTLGHGEARQHVDAALAPDATLSGTVKAVGGGPLSGVEVFAASTDTGGYGSATTAEDGTYTIEGLPAGHYKVEFFANGQYYETQWYDGAGTEESAAVIALTSGEERTGVDAELLPDATISGQVTAPDHEPLAGIEVYVASAYQSFYAYTDESGRYEAHGLPAGSYKVEFYAGGQYYETQWYDGKSSQEAADVIALAAGESATGIDATLSPDATISGKVTAEGGAPLSDINVYARSTDSAYAESAITAEDGTYSVPGLPAGDYKLEFYAYGQNYETQWYDNQDSEAEADILSVTAGQERTGVDAVLRPDATVSGTVSAAGGEPLASIAVDVRSTESGLSESAETDPDGHYTVEGLPAGEYTVQFVPNGLYYADRWYDEKESEAEATALTLTSGEAKVGVDAHLDRTAAAIKGSVTDGHGQPLAGLEVVVTEGEGGIVGTATTAADGTYVVDGLQAGTYKVEFESGSANLLPQFYAEQGSAATATPVAVASDSVVGHIDAVMRPGATIAGTVKAVDGTPLSGVEVSVFDASGAFMQAVTSEGDGSYALSSLSAGTYTVSFEPTGSDYVGQFYDEAAESATATPIVLAAGATREGIDARLAEGATVEGTVTAAAGGAPLEGVELHLQPTGGGPGGSTITNSEGKYAVTGLRPGGYTVQFVPTVGNYAGLYYDGKSEPAEASVITLAGGATRTGVDAALAAGAAIAGKVTDKQTHAPVPGVQVSIEPAEGAGQPVTTTTGVDGSYSLSGLLPGQYLVAFEPNEAEYLDQYYDDAEGAGSANPVTLQAGSNVEGVDAALVESATVSGEVTAAKTGSPIGEAEVAVASTEGGVVRTATTGEDGSYSVTALPPGSYTVEFGAEGQNYLSQFYNGQSRVESAQTLAVAAGERLAGIDADLAGGATVGGTVTDAPSGLPVAGVEVFAAALEGSADGVATTGANGHYSIVGLSAGKYVVQFEPTESNDLGQFYDDAGSAAEAEPVTLPAEANKGGIDAALASGATISGTITEAATAAPLPGIEVVAYTSVCNGAGGLAMTDEAGHYEIQGIAPGAYHLVFNPNGGSYESRPYATEIELATNSHEEGVDGSLAGSSIDSPPFALTCSASLFPVNLSPPSISGTAIVEQTLSELHGSWSNDPTGYSYQWLRCDSSGTDCQEVSGAAAQTYTLTSSDLEHTIRVQEVARNALGTGEAALSAPTAIVQKGTTAGPGSGNTSSGGPTTIKSAPSPNLPPKRKCRKGKRLSHGKCIRKSKKKHRHKH